MKNKIISYVENDNIKNKKLINFRVGYVLEVKIWVIENNKKRLQSFVGIVISIKKKYINTCFTLRKISYGEGVERTFKIYSPIIDSIIIKKKNVFRKSKLYFLRNNNKFKNKC